MANLTTATPLNGIDCDGPHHSGMKLALAARLEQMCRLREAALDWSDPEGVHKMRVASRRLRCALEDFAPYLGKRRTAATLKHIKELARALGSVRDIDVSILTLEQTAAKAPPEVTPGIGSFVQFQDAGRQQARAKLATVLTGESLAELSKNFAAMIAAEGPRARRDRSPQQKAAKATPITYRQAAGTIVVKRLEELEELSDSLYQPLKTEPLHKMRIAAKSLRYALQLFEHCWGSQAVFFAKQVAGLQSSLGNLHDCDVWIDEFGQTLKSKVAVPDFDSRTLVWLLRHFIKVRAKNLSRTLKQWQEWEAKEFGAGLRDMIAGS